MPPDNPSPGAVRAAEELPESYQCERCGAKLNPKRIVWLELDTRTSRFYRTGEFPEGGLSQGAFPFGPDCAKIELDGGDR